MKKKITNTVKRKFGTEIVIAEISDTSKGFYWRLRIGKFYTGWYSFYEGICCIRSQKTDNLYGYFTAYWSGEIPIEQPILLSCGEVIK